MIVIISDACYSRDMSIIVPTLYCIMLLST